MVKCTKGTVFIVYNPNVSRPILKLDVHGLSVASENMLCIASVAKNVGIFPFCRMLKA